MFVLGIDPGLSRCGYGCVASEKGEERAIAAGVITTDPNEALPMRLARLEGELSLQPDGGVGDRGWSSWSSESFPDECPDRGCRSDRRAASPSRSLHDRGVVSLSTPRTR